MSEFDESADLIEWLRQPRWMEGAKQKRLFEAANAIEQLRSQNELMRKTLETIAGNSTDRLQATQARGALSNIGPA